MKRTHLLSAAALGTALLAAPAFAEQRSGTGDAVATAQNRATADVDRMHKGNGTNGGPAELLRLAQAAMRRGQTAQANELLERAETRLLLRNGVEPAQPVQGEPAHHVSEARRALMGRDRAEAMRHTNLAIATVRDDSSFSGMDAAVQGAQGGGMGSSRPGTVDSGMGTLPRSGGGGAVVRDTGSSGTTISRAEGVVLAQTGGSGGSRGGSSALPPGDSIPGWSVAPRGGASGQTGGVTTPPPGAPNQNLMPDSFSQGGRSPLDFSSPPSGPGTSGITGGAPARVGGAPPADTSRAPGSSGIGPSGPTGLGVPPR